MKSSELKRLLSNHIHPKLGLSVELVNSICKSICSKKYKGLYVSHSIPFDQLKHESTFTIIVLLPGRSTGHYVMIHATPSTVFYVDSYGLPCFDKNARSFLKKLATDTKWKKRKLFVNNKQIQHPKSMYCGLYAVLFAKYFDKNDHKEKITLKFPVSQSLSNDKRCVKYINKLIE